MVMAVQMRSKCFGTCSKHLTGNRITHDTSIKRPMTASKEKYVFATDQLLITSSKTDANSIDEDEVKLLTNEHIQNHRTKCHEFSENSVC